MNLRRWIRTIVFSVLVLMVISAVSYACPMCKDSIPSTDASQPSAVPTGFNYSVYTLLFGVIAVMACVCGMIFKVVREGNRWTHD
jgi:hypothetical protein